MHGNSKKNIIHPDLLPRTMSDDSATKLMLAFAAFFLLLNFPLLAIFDRQTLLWGVPSLYFYLFFVWLGLIVVVFWIVHNRRKDRRS